MRDEFSQILDSAWEESLPGDAKLCLADMKVSKGNTENTNQGCFSVSPMWNYSRSHLPCDMNLS